MNDEMAKKESWTPLLKNYPFSRKINAVSIGAEAMFCRLLARCDDHSNYIGDPKKICARLFTDRWATGEVTPEMVTEWLQELKNKELIAIYRDGGDPFLHVIRCKKMLRKDIKEDLRFPPTPASISKRYRNDNGPSPSSSPSSSSSKKKGEEYDEVFSKWWEDYPRKLNKRFAYTKWKARLREGMTPEFLTACLRKYKARLRKDGTAEQYTLHASTFLNGRWEDFEPDPLDMLFARHNLSQGDKDDCHDYLKTANPDTRQRIVRNLIKAGHDGEKIAEELEALDGAKN